MRWAANKFFPEIHGPAMRTLNVHGVQMEHRHTVIGVFLQSKDRFATYGVGGRLRDQSIVLVLYFTGMGFAISFGTDNDPSSSEASRCIKGTTSALLTCDFGFFFCTCANMA